MRENLRRSACNAQIWKSIYTEGERGHGELREELILKIRC